MVMDNEVCNGWWILSQKKCLFGMKNRKSQLLVSSIRWSRWFITLIGTVWRGWSGIVSIIGSSIGSSISFIWRLGWWTVWCRFRWVWRCWGSVWRGNSVTIRWCRGTVTGRFGCVWAWCGCRVLVASWGRIGRGFSITWVTWSIAVFIGGRGGWRVGRVFWIMFRIIVGAWSVRWTSWWVRGFPAWVWVGFGWRTVRGFRVFIVVSRLGWWDIVLLIGWSWLVVWGWWWWTITVGTWFLILGWIILFRCWWIVRVGWWWWAWCCRWSWSCISTLYYIGFIWIVATRGDYVGWRVGWRWWTRVGRGGRRWCRWRANRVAGSNNCWFITSGLIWTGSVGRISGSGQFFRWRCGWSCCSWWWAESDCHK